MKYNNKYHIKYSYFHSSVVATNNNNTSINQQLMAPVPSVCVRVPHSPSIDSRKSDSPGSPRKIYQFATLAVRECATRLHVFVIFINFFFVVLKT